MGRQAKLKASVDHGLKIEARRRRAGEDREAIRSYLRQEFGASWPEAGEGWQDFLLRHDPKGDMQIRIEEGVLYKGTGVVKLSVPFRRIRSLIHPFRVVDLPLR